MVVAKILLMSLGSRGDIEPFLAAGEALQEQGHKIAFCLPGQFQSLASEVTTIFYPMSPAFLDLMNDPGVKRIMGQIGTPISRLKTSLRLMKTSRPLQQTLIRDQKAAVDDFEPDKIIHHIKCIYPIVTALRQERSVELLSPVPAVLHAVNHEPAVGFGKPRNKRWNRFTYKIANAFLINQFIKKTAKTIVEEQGWVALDSQEIKKFLLSELPVEFAISDKLFPRPSYWPHQVTVTAFKERNKRRHWQPSPDLSQFLSNHPKPLYIGFGSMVNDRPKEIGSIILKVTEELNVPVILNSSWGGIELPTTLPTHAYPLSDIPFDWLFPKVRGVVHHGGAGTTHSALSFNIPQLIIPHMGDQFMWQRLLVKAEYGPKGFSIKEFSEEALRDGLINLMRFDRSPQNN